MVIEMLTWYSKIYIESTCLCAFVVMGGGSYTITITPNPIYIATSWQKNINFTQKMHKKTLDILGEYPIGYLQRGPCLDKCLLRFVLHNTTSTSQYIRLL